MPPSESQPGSPPLPRPCPDSQPVPACPALPHSHQSRGVRENGAVFLAPTYLFLLCMFIAIAIGIAKTVASGGHPHPVTAPPSSHPTIAGVSGWLPNSAFAGGMYSPHRAACRNRLPGQGIHHRCDRPQQQGLPEHPVCCCSAQSPVASGFTT